MSVKYYSYNMAVKSGCAVFPVHLLTRKEKPFSFITMGCSRGGLNLINAIQNMTPIFSFMKRNPITARVIGYNFIIYYQIIQLKRPNYFSIKFNLFHLGTAPAEAGGAVPRLEQAF